MIFAFGPGVDSYYIQHSKRAYWNNLPRALERVLETEKHFAPDKIVYLNLFPNGGYFAVGSKGDVVSDKIPGSISRSLTRAGLIVNDPAGIEIDTTNLDRFIAVHGTDILSNSLPPSFLEAAFSYSFKGGVKIVALGRNGNWAIIGVDGKVSASVRNPWLQEQLLGKKEIRSVCLSPFNDQFGFIEFMDGNSMYAVPQGWRPAIENIAPRLGKFSGFLHILSQDEEFIKFASEQSNELAQSATTAALGAL